MEADPVTGLSLDTMLGSMTPARYDLNSGSPVAEGTLPAMAGRLGPSEAGQAAGTLDERRRPRPPVKRGMHRRSCAGSPGGSRARGSVHAAGRPGRRVACRRASARTWRYAAALD